LLAEAFERLGFDDPSGRLLTAIASFPLEAIVNGLAIYEGRLRAGTLPQDVDARYLRGIIRNLAGEAELYETSEALLRLRLRTHDLMLAHLAVQRDQLEEDPDDPLALVVEMVDRALKATRSIDRTFWLLATADILNADVDPQQGLRVAARRISTTHSVPLHRRHAALRLLHAKVRPLQ